MKVIKVVFFKEMLMTFRDKRSLFTSIVLPVVLIPLLLVLVTSVQKNMMDKEKTKKIEIALLDPNKLIRANVKDSTFVWSYVVDTSSGIQAVMHRDADAFIAAQVHKDTLNLNDVEVKLYINSTNLTIKDRIQEKINTYIKIKEQERLKELRINERLLQPVLLKTMDVASTKEQIGTIIGGFIPYIFILFSFMGCMYPSIDLITGEKEKKTLETLMSVPAAPFDILAGKVLTAAFFGFISALLSMLGLALMLQYNHQLPPVIIQAIKEIVTLKFMMMLLGMLVPLTLFFSGILTFVICRAKSFKEAQSVATPLTFVVVVPAALALLPGMQLNWQTCFIPILNVSLATKQIISETIQWQQYLVILLALITYCVAAIYWSYKQFIKEEMLINN